MVLLHLALKAPPVMRRPVPRIARAALSSATSQMDGGDDLFGGPRPPSEKQLQYAQSLALSAAEALPPDAMNDGLACSEFIDRCLQKVPPSDRQAQYAQILAEQKGVELPGDVLLSAGACSKFIDQLNGGARNATVPGLPNAPSQKQLLYAISLAQKAKVGLSAAVLQEKMECSAFIDDMLNGGSNGQAQGADAAAFGAAAAAAGVAGSAEPQAADAISRADAERLSGRGGSITTPRFSSAPLHGKTRRNHADASNGCLR